MGAFLEAQLRYSQIRNIGTERDLLLGIILSAARQEAAAREVAMQNFEMLLFVLALLSVGVVSALLPM